MVCQLALPGIGLDGLAHSLDAALVVCKGAIGLCKAGQPGKTTSAKERRFLSGIGHEPPGIPGL